MQNLLPQLTLALDKIRRLIGKRLSMNPSVLEAHGQDESWHAGVPPDAVCFVQGVNEVSAIVNICYEYTIPVIPFGTGTGMEGQVVAVQGGICINLSGMDQILAVNQQDFDCRVQAGVTGHQLNKHLRQSGLFFSVDPGADASIGGMAATRASGTNTVRYGTMRENVLALKVVMADGRIIKTAGRARKSAAGYDLTHLFVGSEGTLGIIVEITLRLHARAESIAAASVYFNDIENAVTAVQTTMQNNIPMARIELLDSAQMAAINNYSKTEYPIKPTLFVEFHGSKAGVQEQAILFGEICDEQDGGGFSWTSNTEERSRLWAARHNAAYAAMAVQPNAKVVATDVCVPISRLAECIRETRKDAEQNSRLATMLAGHVGDGNFHFVFIVNKDNQEEVAQMEAIHSRLIHRALAMDGTCTGEHGIGIGKQQYLMDEFGADTLDIMRSIKRALDPKGIMNPGKKLPPSTA